MNNMINEVPALPRALGSVSIPIVRDEIAGALTALFDLWADRRFAPGPTNGTPKPVLVVVVNKAAPSDLERIEQLFAARPVLADAFSAIHPYSADLDGSRDLYLRGTESNIEPDSSPIYGHRAGPNFLFFETMDRAARFGGYTLQLETDCLPFQSGWLGAAQCVLGRNIGAWVIGSSFAGVGPIDQAASLHLNGNALYHTGDQRFMDFLETVWRPRLFDLVSRMPNIAYDCWWSYERARVDVCADNDAWRLVRRYDCMFRNEAFVVNLLGKDTNLPEYLETYDHFARLGRPPLFLHGPAMRQLARVLLHNPNDSVVSGIMRLYPSFKPDAWPWPMQRLEDRNDHLTQASDSWPLGRLLLAFEEAPQQSLGVILGAIAARLVLERSLRPTLPDDQLAKLTSLLRDRVDLAPSNCSEIGRGAPSQSRLAKRIVSLLNSDENDDCAP